VNVQLKNVIEPSIVHFNSLQFKTIQNQNAQVIEMKMRRKETFNVHTKLASLSFNFFQKQAQILNDFTNEHKYKRN